MGGKHKKCIGDGCVLIASFGYNKVIGTKIVTEKRNSCCAESAVSAHVK